MDTQAASSCALRSCTHTMETDSAWSNFLCQTCPSHFERLEGPTTHLELQCRECPWSIKRALILKSPICPYALSILPEILTDSYTIYNIDLNIFPKCKLTHGIGCPSMQRVPKPGSAVRAPSRLLVWGSSGMSLLQRHKQNAFLLITLDILNYL